MKKILVLGAAGMAGHVIYTYLKELNKYNVVGTSNSNNLEGVNLKLNIFESKSVIDLIRDVKPDVIVNCIGMLIKASKENPDQTIYGNAYFPHFLKKIANAINAKLIHISTDCVFSGKSGGYTEFSEKDAKDLYGLSKNLGEIIDDKHLTIRTSIIGPEIKLNGEGLFHWFMKQNSSVNGFKSNIWSGVTTLELAKFIDWQMDHLFTGLVHLTNNQPISKYDLLNHFNVVYNKNLEILSEKDYVCDKSFINTNPKLNFKVSDYTQMLVDQKSFINNHKTFYESIYF